MSPWVYWVARRYFFSRRKGSSMVPALLSVLGIAAGVMTLMVVLGVMNGFQHSTIESILELNSYHLRVTGDIPDGNPWMETLRSIPLVRSAFPFAEVPTLIQGVFPEPLVCSLRFFPEEILELDPSLKNHLGMVEGKFDLKDPAGVLLGVELARYLGVGVGDRVNILRVSVGQPTQSPQMEPFEVKGVWKSGYYEYDANWVIVPLRRLKDLEGRKGSLLIGVKLKNRFKDLVAQKEVSNLLPPSARITSWREYNRAIFGALRTEKTIMLLLIGLIFVVVGMNIYRAQQRHISERLEEIGVLRGMGASAASVKAIFVWEGCLIGGLGAFLGNTAGFYLASRINQVFRLAEGVINAFLSAVNLSFRVSLFSPAHFYITEVRASIPFGEAFFVTFIALTCTTLSAWFASRRVVSIYPNEVLRYE